MYISAENAERLVSMLNTEMTTILNQGVLSKDTLCLLGQMVDIMKALKEMDNGQSMDSGYSRNSYNSYNNHGGYSYRRGYSRMGERERLLDTMDQYMAQASNESERQLIQRIMNSI